MPWGREVSGSKASEGQLHSQPEPLDTATALLGISPQTCEPTGPPGPQHSPLQSPGGGPWCWLSSGGWGASAAHVSQLARRPPSPRAAITRQRPTAPRERQVPPLPCCHERGPKPCLREHGLPSEPLLSWVPSSLCSERRRAGTAPAGSGRSCAGAAGRFVGPCAARWGVAHGRWRSAGAPGTSAAISRGQHMLVPTLEATGRGAAVVASLRPRV